jgi:broad specificity phosphatase PhoE
MNKRIEHNPDFTRLLILRHAQTALNVKGKMQGNTDAPLNETGIQQAQLLAERLYRLYSIDHIFSSPYPRAVQTAEIVAGKYGLTVETNRDLMENAFGEIDNQRFTDLAEISPDFFQQTNMLYETAPEKKQSKPVYPGGESIADLKQRVDNFTDLLLEKHKGKCVAAVSHGGFSKYMIARYIGLPLEQPFFMSVDNTSISVVDFYNRRAILRSYNDSGHLDSPCRYTKPTVV